MRSLFTVLSLVASACAYQILTPSNSSGWTTVGPNLVTWSRVSTDPTNFTMVLVNQDKTVMPSGDEVLIATVDGTQNSIAVPAPSGGFVVAPGYQVNFVKDPQDLNTILAQSNMFSITQPNTSSTTTSPSNTVVTPAVITAAQTGTSATDSSGNLNPTASSNTTTNGADRVTAVGSTGLIFAALAAFFL